MNKTIKEMSDVEIKALKSDIYEEMSRLQASLGVLNGELALRGAKEPVEAVATKVEGAVE